MVLLALAACNPGSPAPTPSPTRIGGSLLMPLRLQPSGPTIPSPDGKLIAQLASTGTLTFLTADGDVVATFTPGPAEAPLAQFSWVPDSLAVLAWPLSGLARPASVSLIDTHGRRTALGIGANSAAVSLSGRWIAANHVDENGVVNGVDIVSRSGGAARTFGPCTQFLGWRGDKVICSKAVALYSLDPQSAEHTLLPTPGRADLVPPVDGPFSSPDGAVVMLTENNTTYLALTGSGLKPLSSDLAYSPLGFVWVGPHQALGVSASMRVDYVDVESGAITQTSPAIVDGSVDAASGNWVAWMGATTVHLSDLKTGRDIDLGIRGTAYALTANRFLLRGDSALYLVQAPTTSV